MVQERRFHGRGSTGHRLAWLCCCSYRRALSAGSQGKGSGDASTTEAVQRHRFCASAVCGVGVYCLL